MTLPCLTAALPARHGFFTRIGGHSSGAYASLNCSFSGGDDYATILRNRTDVAAAVGVAPENLLGVKQVHGARVIRVDEPWVIGQGMDADAMVTAMPGLAIGVITADCAPVLFSNRAGTVVGAAHAGWRGAVAGILEATAAAMKAIGGGSIIAAIGPCIHRESYEVGDDLRDAVIQHDRTHAAFFIAGAQPGKYQFDLPGYCAARLAAIGIVVQILPHNTFADDANFFSHRRRVRRGEAAIGHQISVIRL